MLHRVLKRAGLPKVRFHDLQHTFATLALQNGVDIKTRSGMLGRFSAGFTLDIYTYVTGAAQCQAAQTMAGVLEGSNPNVSPEQRGTFGREAQRRERTLPRTARGEIRSLCRRGSKYRSNSRHKNKPGRKVIKKSAEIIRFQRILVVGGGLEPPISGICCGLDVGLAPLVPSSLNPVWVTVWASGNRCSPEVLHDLYLQLCSLRIAH